MRWIRRIGVALALLGAGTGAVSAQAVPEATKQAYFGAVAEFFDLPRSEVNILGEWRLPVDEIPVALYVARRAGVSPEALVALRGAGRGWAELAGRYRVDASHFHVPLADDADAGSLTAVYQRFRALPASRWGEVTLGDADIVGLVNVRLLAQTLKRTPAQVLAGGGTGSWAELYARLIGSSLP